MILSDPLKEIVDMAKENATRSGCRVLLPDHVAEAILQKGVVSRALRSVGIDPESLLQHLQNEMKMAPSPLCEGGALEEDGYQKLMCVAKQKAKDRGFERIPTSCVFAAITSLMHGPARRVFHQFNMDEDMLDALIGNPARYQSPFMLEPA